MEPLGESRQRLKSGLSEMSALSETDQRLFQQMVGKAREYAGNGNVKAALEISHKAYKMCPSAKLKKKIDKMEAYLAENNSDGEEEEDDMKHLGNGFHLYHEMYNKLYQHQKEGVLWLWNLYKKGKGGILGDDMGLGKTIQVIAFLSGMFDSQELGCCLIVMPVSVIPNWEREFDKWAPGINVTTFHGSSKKERERVLYRTQRRGGVLLTSYGMVVSSWELLRLKDGREYVYDYMILDEGHKIKNPTKTSKGVHAIPARNRIILSGTPIQNNLRELWALFDFVHQGRLLGTQKTFKMEYEGPITRSRERDATMGEKRLGQEMAESLKSIIAPYFLQRTKAQIAKENKENKSPKDTHAAVMPTLSRKNDLVVWLSLTALQIKIYSDFLELDNVKELLMTTKSPLVALTVLKKICDHPRLLTTMACRQLGLASNAQLEYDSDDERGHECAANMVKAIPNSVLLEECGKLGFIVKLLRQLRSEGHRCLIFSQSRKMLDIIQRVLQEEGHKIMRLDGTVKFMSEREELVQKFQRDATYNVFLLTTQVGGVGLTLTGADRVIIFDPSWNPATDAQAVDRVFRIGQDKNVVVYRLITCGSVEEKIYRRQIFKDSITKQTTGKSSNPYRYFSRGQLRELFTLDDPHHSTTQLQLQDLHSNHRKTDQELDDHFAFLYSTGIFGISDHDLMFSQEPDDATDEEPEEGHSNYIESRVQKARQLLTMEADQAGQVENFCRPMVPDVPKSQRSGPSNWEMPSSQPTSYPAVRRLPSDDDIVDLGDMDTSLIDDDEINRTLEDLTIHDDESSKLHVKQNIGLAGGFRELHGSKASRKSEIIEIPDSAENSLLEQNSYSSLDTSSKPGDSPDAAISIAESDEDDLPTISRPKSRNRRLITEDFDEETDRSPIKSIGVSHDVEMRSPFSATPARKMIDTDVYMASPVISRGGYVVDSEDEAMNISAVSFSESRMPKSLNKKEQNDSLHSSTHHLKGSEPFEHNDSPIMTASKSAARRPVIASDSEDDIPDFESENLPHVAEEIPETLLHGTDSEELVERGDLRGQVAPPIDSKAHEPIVPTHDQADLSGEEEIEDVLESGEEDHREAEEMDNVSLIQSSSKSATRRRIIESDSEDELTDEAGESQEEDEDEGENDEESQDEAEGVDESSCDGAEMEDAEVPGAAAPDKVQDEDQKPIADGENDDKIGSDEEGIDESEEEESGEEESEEDDDDDDDDEEEDEIQEKVNKLQGKMKQFIASKDYKKALLYGVEAYKLDRSNQKILEIIKALKKKVNL